MVLTVDALLIKSVVIYFGIGNEYMGTTTFYRQLPQPTSDDIEMRVCRDEDKSNEDFMLTFIEIYVVQ